MSSTATRLLWGLSAALGRIPERPARALARAAAWLWWYALRYRRAVMLENLARAFPDASAAARRSLGRAAAVHLTLSLVELFRIPAYRARGYAGVVRLEGMEHLDAARALGRGALALTGHLGSFELAVAAAVGRAGPVNLVVKRFSAGFDAFLTGLRRDSGLGVIPADGALREVLRALRRNETVAIALDQNATRQTGVFVEFFGERACTPSALAVLALKTGAPVVVAVPHRAEDGTHVLRMYPAIPLEPRATRSETVAHMTAVYTRRLEEAIRAHPAQWFWTHKRWRTRPR